MWLRFLGEVTVQALALGLLVAGLIYLAFPEGMGRVIFIVLSALLIAGHGALAGWRHAGRELKKYLGHRPATAEAFSAGYIWREHVLGNALINYGINALVGYVMFHGGPQHPEPLVAVSALMVDIAVMCVAVAVLVPIGATIQAKNDVGEGRVLRRGLKTSSPAMAARWLVFIALALLFLGLLWAVLSLFHIASLSLLTIMTIKGLLSALLAGLVAGLAAWWAAR
jgi:hypothetical protein